MKRRNLSTLLTLILLYFLVPGCYRDDTKYYQDAEDAGLSIFSNTSNNIMSCYINGKPWRTVSRTSGAFRRSIEEVFIKKYKTNSLYDTLTFEWIGFYVENSNQSGRIRLIMPVSKTFGYKEISALQGQRININPTTGYFATSGAGLNLNNIKGIGNIYFHTAQFDSIGPNNFRGKMSGLFEADFTSLKILNGRFDHFITEKQVSF